ncbi:Protease synthase and sporulation negative regulatory protein PAI 1 [Bacillus sp. THAF10]|uniref:GNAT family N-acetyltransferase n=1 Tax=Bacillus sp. THAF10 TaxID=2587848 RepID=UPI001268C3BF|nr:GNAT family N-acetyltransferase [Bacillus sp. THAF10]QFT91127.1 Protease synthase and sporulation negative regulatory protein PAI 1 [Bacillus sp. THAF10]
MKLVIRKMNEEDIQQVQQVAKISWNHTYEGIIPREVQDNFLQSAYNDAMMHRRLEQSIVFVAEMEGKIVGFANFSGVKDEGKVELAAIYLYPEFQGNGIGTKLLEKGIIYLDGVKEMYINVEKDNAIGKAFYEAKGFQVVSEFDDDFDGHILKTIRMKLLV